MRLELEKNYRKIFIALALFCSIDALGQAPDSVGNMVFNPSFEENLGCPKRIESNGVLTIVEAWYQPTRGSADYYNRCGLRPCNVPSNALGIQEPHSGDAYCGIYCSKTEYREYLQTELKEPMKKGCTYMATFYASLSEYSSCAVATIGALFTANRVTDTSWRMLAHHEYKKMGAGSLQTITTDYEPQIENPYDSILHDTHKWYKIEGSFTAEGGERFMTIGNFKSAGQSNIIEPDTLERRLGGAYYFIDDVSVVEIACPDPPLEEPAPPPPPVEERYSPGTTIILHDLFFDFNKSTILQQSYHQLHELIEMLNETPTMKIALLGHTDNKGNKNYNQRLSEERAKAVADYLIGKGIDKKRITAKGFGSTMPIDTNTTDEGRANNRRVELQILSY